MRLGSIIVDLLETAMGGGGTNMSYLCVSLGVLQDKDDHDGMKEAAWTIQRTDDGGYEGKRVSARRQLMLP